MSAPDRTPRTPVDVEAARNYWQWFKQNQGLEASLEFAAAFQFGDSAELANKLADLVAEGPKRATCGTLAGYQAINRPIPAAGDYWIVCDGSGAPAAVVRATEVRVGPLSSVDDAFARDEGEGDCSRAYWLEAHSRAFTRECHSTGHRMHPDIEAVFTRFDLLSSTQDPAASGTQDRSADAHDLKRIAEFEEAFARAQATDVADLDWGYVLFQRDFPSSHDHNRLVVHSTVKSEDVLSTVDQAKRGPGPRHRKVSVIDKAVGLQLTHDLLAAGFERAVITTMIYRGDPTARPEHHVHVVSPDATRAALARDWKLLLPNSADEVHEQLSDRTFLYASGAEVVRLAVLEHDEIAARMDLFLDAAHGTAQLQNLFTHPDFRGRGYARSLIVEGLRRGRDEGCLLAFLGADLDDWPHEWYARLGFQEAHRSYDFTRSV